MKQSTWNMRGGNRGGGSSSIVSAGLGLNRTLQKIAASIPNPIIIKVKKPSAQKTLLTDDQVRDARRSHEINGETRDQIAARFGLTIAYTGQLLSYATRSKVYFD